MTESLLAQLAAEREAHQRTQRQLRLLDEAAAAQRAEKINGAPKVGGTFGTNNAGGVSTTVAGGAEGRSPAAAAAAAATKKKSGGGGTNLWRRGISKLTAARAIEASPLAAPGVVGMEEIIGLAEARSSTSTCHSFIRCSTQEALTCVAEGFNCVVHVAVYTVRQSVVSTRKTTDERLNWWCLRVKQQTSG